MPVVEFNVHGGGQNTESCCQQGSTPEKPFSVAAQELKQKIEQAISSDAHGTDQCQAGRPPDHIGVQVKIDCDADADDKRGGDGMAPGIAVGCIEYLMVAKTRKKMSM